MGFLDRQPFDAGDPDGRALLAALQAVYDQAPAVRELVLAAGLRPADFPWLAPMSQVWPEVLRKAADRGRLRSLITVVAHDPGSAAYEVIARLASEPAGDGAQHPAGRPEPVIGSGQRLAYLEQIRRIAPPDPPGLIGREEELAGLARFCLQPDGGPYAWWQADAWAGKSALLSTFVLRPPPQVAQRVRIVSFFVTARLAAQDTREAFIQVLLEQLAALLDQPLPPALPEATREAFLLGLLTETATMCAERGGRLVLVVDGLDEDRGVTIGPDAHSIAGMLPADPSHGMRVIVAGRPNPPVPDDVPDWHPLRKPEIIRPLGASPYAGDLKRLSRQELRRLLGGSRADQEVLGLLTAAHGGLSAPDLAELTGIPLWEAEEILHTAAGRTFTRRASRWAPGSGPETYLLGHEELQAAAVTYLGENRLSAYRERLHGWARTWQARGWPPGTPEYLLGGYYRLLDEFGDLPRMIECARDLARHDRMLDITGGDSGAIAEVRTVLDRIAAQDTPDLAAAITLACHRDYLVSRNANIPAELPAVWATLGHVPRADALAASIIAPRARAEALAGVARALARNGLHEQAQAVAQSITYTRARAYALAGVARALARDGQPEQAEAIARSIPYSGPRAQALAEVAGALSAAGQHEQAVAIAARAEAVAQSITNPSTRGRALADVAGALARDKLHEQAEAAARSITSPVARAGALAEVAGALAAAGQREQAAAVAAQAEVTARSITHGSARVQALAKVAGALAAAGHREQAAAVAAQAEATAGSITSPGTRAHALAGMAAVLARGGLHEQAEAVARSITKPGAQAQALAEIAGPLARDGLRQQAEAVARSITNADLRAQALAEVAGALAAAGQHGQAAAVAAQAEVAARSIANLDWRARALADVAGALAAAGQHEQAQAITRSLRGRGARTRALAGIADALAAAGQYEQAEAAAQSITDPGARAHALAAVARALAAAGLREQATTVGARAEAIARSVTHSNARAQALADVAGELAAAGQREQAAAVAAQAEAAARSITNTDWQAQAKAKIAGVLAATGYREQAVQAEAVALSITSPYWQAQAWGRIAGALAAAGRHEQAHAIVQSITRSDWQERAWARIAGALTAAGQYEQAHAIARGITTPGRRARILADVAEGLARTGQTDSASQLAALTCATGDWMTAVRPVMLLDPSTCTLVIAILDAL